MKARKPGYYWVFLKDENSEEDSYWTIGEYTNSDDDCPWVVVGLGYFLSDSDLAIIDENPITERYK